MFKRLTDCDKWEDDWFSELSIEHKLAWIFLTDKCNNAGVWKPNFRIANALLNLDINWSEFKEVCGPRIEVLDNGKWWLTKFVEFQCGVLSPKSHPHKKVVRLLDEENLLSRLPARVVSRVLTTLQEEEVYKEEEKETAREILESHRTLANEKMIQIGVPKNRLDECLEDFLLKREAKEEDAGKELNAWLADLKREAGFWLKRKKQFEPEEEKTIPKVG
jgi:hypothetical protein